MKRLYSLVSLFALAYRRLSHHAGLSLSSALGMISILGLVVCVPVFTNGVLSQILKDQLAEKAARNRRSLFSLHIYYPDNPDYLSLTTQGIHRVSEHMLFRLQDGLSLHVADIVVQMNTPPLVWKPEKVASSKPAFNQIYMSFFSSEVLAGKIRLVEGRWPEDPSSEGQSGAQRGPIQAVVHETYADDNFLNVGDIYRSGDVRVEIVGIVRAIDPYDPTWFYHPDITLRNALWVPTSYFEDRLPEVFDRLINYASWYAIVDDASLRFSRSRDYARGMLRLENELRTMLPKASIDYSPLDMLKTYEDRLKILIALFYAAGAPVFTLALLFTGLVSAIAIEEVRAETAVIGARGASGKQVLALNLAESAALLGLSLPLALGVGWLAAGLMGQTALFLQFTRRSGYTFSLADVDLAWVGLAVLGILFARLLPLLRQPRPSILVVQGERGRAARGPIWERYFLDLGLLIPGGYAYLAMRWRYALGAQAGLQEAATEGGYDPLMFLASSIFAIALCMLALRLFPLILRLLGALTARLPGAWAYLAVQEAIRRPRDHASAMLLILISLSFCIFSASMARTLDRWLNDAQYHAAGTDLVVKEYEMPLDQGFPAGGGPPAAQPTSSTRVVESIVSLERHLKLPEIESATYVGKWKGTFSYGAAKQACFVMGIDRLTFPATAFFRSDYAAESLGALMNSLGARRLGVLIPESLAERTGLIPGDQVQVEAPIGVGAEWVVAKMTVVGVYRHFPTVYPGAEPTLIANLDALFGGPDAVTGVDVWLRLRPGSQVGELLDGLRKMASRDMLLVDVRGNALAEVSKGMSRPEWVGLFGVLNVGFFLTGLLPGIGFVLYSFAALRRRLIQFGILQALGLSTRQAESSLVLEQALMMSVSLAGGAGVGLVTSALFLPFLQVGVAGAVPVPPFVVLVGWREAGWFCLAFAGVFLITLVGMIISLAKMKIFQAVKMGETV